MARQAPRFPQSHSPQGPIPQRAADGVFAQELRDCLTELADNEKGVAS
jgi:hypothetical protein